MPSSQARDFLSVEETLLAATDNGIFTISDNQATYLRKSLDTKVWETFVLHQSKSVTNRVFAGVTYGMAILELNNGRWQDGGHVPGFEDEIISIAETDRGVLWAGTRSNGILRIIFTSDGDNLLEDVQVDRFDQQHVLIDIDETSYEGGTNGDYHPMSWHHEYDGGRAWYTGMGHTEESFSEPFFLQHLLGGIRYAMGSGELDYAKARPEENRFTKTILTEGLDEPMYDFERAFPVFDGIYNTDDGTVLFAGFKLRRHENRADGKD